jgi:hypothetical protein
MKTLLSLAILCAGTTLLGQTDGTCTKSPVCHIDDKGNVVLDTKPPAPEKAASPPLTLWGPFTGPTFLVVASGYDPSLRFTCAGTLDEPADCKLETGTLDELAKVLIDSGKQHDVTEADLRARLKIATDALHDAVIAMRAAHKALEADRRAFEEIHRTLLPDPKKK